MSDAPRPDPAHVRLLRGRRQPDGYSCGASCVLAVPMLTDPVEADRLRPTDAWDAAVLRAHRQLVAVRDPEAPGPALPWPRRLGTPPWAAARRLRAEPGGRWAVRVVRTGRADGWAALTARARVGDPSLLCVGNAFSPRHFLLVLPDASDASDAFARADGADRAELTLWDPGRGEVRPLARDGFVAAGITGGSFAVPWFVVVREPDA